MASPSAFDDFEIMPEHQGRFDVEDTSEPQAEEIDYTDGEIGFAMKFDVDEGNEITQEGPEEGVLEFGWTSPDEEHLYNLEVVVPTVLGSSIGVVLLAAFICVCCVCCCSLAVCFAVRFRKRRLAKQAKLDESYKPFVEKKIDAEVSKV